ncbi:DnaD domain-containing protein [Vagococcus sp.]|uniref:DnaD domain-containing protein n=1 Tax=Vagococcus sp. TaxID=1933889 RepID=UPI003F9A85C2
MLDLAYYLNFGQTISSNLLLDYYKKVGMTDEEFLVYLQLSKFSQAGIEFPELSQIAALLDYPLEKIFSVVESLIDKKIMTIETQINKGGKSEDRYNLNLVYEKINLLLKQTAEKQQEVKIENKIAQLFQSFEQEFGRSLSPIEYETIQIWLNQDGYSLELIELALREAVLNQAYSLKYMDRILLDWERKNIKTKQQVQTAQKKRKNQYQPTEEPNEEKLPKVPLYNWLNPNGK